MKQMTKLIVLVGVLFFIPTHAFARVELIKSPSSDAVYYLDSKNIRHVFPDRKTYESWYGDDFSKVTVMSGEYIASLPLGKNITMRSGSLVKVPSAAAVYVVEPGAELRKLADESIARVWYGGDWARLVRDVPEAFWENYRLGESIRNEHHVPDGVLYRVKGEGTLYYKWRGATQSIIDTSVLSAVTLEKSPIIEQSDVFVGRPRPVGSHDRKLRDPANELQEGEEDCENTRLNIGVVFIIQDEPDPAHLVSLEQFIREIPSAWSRATGALSSATVATPVMIQKKDAYTLEPQEGHMTISLAEAAYSYFDEHPDNVDFLIVVNDFETFPNFKAEYTLVNNRVSGTGLVLYRGGPHYGSAGKLKGIINMGHVNSIGFTSVGAKAATLSLFLHEMGHAWSGRAVFTDEAGDGRYDLLRADKVHWSELVDFESPLGGYGWVPVADDTLENRALHVPDGYVRKFSPLDLYFMGLYPVGAVGSIGYFEPHGSLEGNSRIAAEPKSVEMKQIIDAMGERKCEI